MTKATCYKSSVHVSFAYFNQFSSYELAQICLLDRSLCVSTFSRAIGLDECEALKRICGRLVGDILPMDRSSVQQKMGWPKRAIDALEYALSKDGLKLGTDVSWWKEYRKLVSDDYRFPGSLTGDVQGKHIAEFDAIYYRMLGALKAIQQASRQSKRLAKMNGANLHPLTNLRLH